ncbi:two component transcriptional regulator, LuxR family [Vibrio cincinnatiensis]|uniref:Two component transcriptional regulator, LuxR family n=1 Tax=Vibrio cincinnatiensis DSM 19608 TaxID=1123491 RepID=A0A1T4NT78_VIBCI|nr:response regulator transcription factor [Vibrio cincinnatiensis]SJZ82461.1 two component transcriptional regulator, LuxR family [Vibrio cincinnatiensis DSM 19608]SUP05464.1 two component transcriptional regulator, LuxR family [Vibrio cincinnatiensis]
MDKNRKKKIIIIDDHPVVVMALKAMLEQNDYQVIATTDNGVDALKLIKEKHPDAIILDIGIPKLDGLEVINRLAHLPDPPKVLVLTAQPSDYYVSRCVQAGAAGFVSKNEELTAVIAALKAITCGYAFFPNQSKFNSYQGDKSNEKLGLKKLSGREMAVFQLLVSGLTNKEISERMLLSNKTISTYKSKIFEKLNVKTLVDLIEIAKQNGII